MAVAGQVGMATVVTVSAVESMKLMESEFELATATVLPSGLTTIAAGASPTSKSQTRRLPRSMTLTVPLNDAPVLGLVTMAVPLDGAVVSPGAARRPPRLATKSFPCVATMPKGALPTSNSVFNVRVSVSISATVFERLNATKACLPSAENAMPVGTGCRERFKEPLGLGLPFVSISAITRRSPSRRSSVVHNSRVPGRKARPA